MLSLQASTCAQSSGWCRDLWEAVLSQIQRIPESESDTQSVQVDVLARFICDNVANRLTESTDLPMEERFEKWLGLGGRNKIIQSPWSTSSAHSHGASSSFNLLSLTSFLRTALSYISAVKRGSPFQRQLRVPGSIRCCSQYHCRDLLLFDDPSMKAIDLGATQRLLGQRIVLCRTENLKPLLQAIARLAKLGSTVDLGDSVKISCGELLHDICSSNYFRSLLHAVS
ncbi:uncharacterized protein EI90DRAFT_1102058 [Cantharellus anzutake]|uniref:uncharacterized protein n=1 Tax=Cantharellus anzutake TaxID=1750568 RepID=UPI001902D8FA|nr:uncharacterized protein EI90DRAFT_1102058 [Cantharellus anzutake]KAF8330836.1 hypothetical protein EI90DRAFT_1102058 [Cantharellus anzutake]